MTHATMAYRQYTAIAPESFADIIKAAYEMPIGKMKASRVITDMLFLERYIDVNLDGMKGLIGHSEERFELFAGAYKEQYFEYTKTLDELKASWAAVTADFESEGGSTTPADAAKLNTLFNAILQHIEQLLSETCHLLGLKDGASEAITEVHGGGGSGAADADGGGGHEPPHQDDASLQQQRTKSQRTTMRLPTFTLKL